MVILVPHMLFHDDDFTLTIILKLQFSRNATCLLTIVQLIRTLKLRM
jgi:hypothetical protein